MAEVISIAWDIAFAGKRAGIERVFAQTKDEARQKFLRQNPTIKDHELITIQRKKAK